MTTTHTHKHTHTFTYLFILKQDVVRVLKSEDELELLRLACCGIAALPLRTGMPTTPMAVRG